ncbi:hypothetical protein HPB48_001107 [Haemaphysalis longicornis]|uniref:Uncharacterized protein n=1 Tax=Haemaphysalis longicornis TaxID=44386 RepID=A0A9J6GFG2_HAELO|nr:hypothetical protein HPB48_001107 [Haemaphysalis longicornis]
MSESLSDVALARKSRNRLRAHGAGFGKAAVTAVLGTLAIIGVCCIAVVLTFILGGGSMDDLANGSDTSLVVTSASLAPTLRKSAAARPQPAAVDHHPLIHPIEPASLSANKLRAVLRKRKSGHNKPKTASPTLLRRNASTEEEIRSVADDASTDSAAALNSTAGLTEQELEFAGGEEDYYAAEAAAFNASLSGGEDNARERAADVTSQRESSTSLLGTSPTLPERTSSGAEPEAASSIAMGSPIRPVEQDNDMGLAIDEETKPGVGSSWTLFCFYDDRSSIRSPGFSVYDFPVQLCTDVVFCCVDVSSKGELVVSKHLETFLRVLGDEFLPKRRLHVALGGHRVLVHHLDLALQNTARLATQLSHGARKLGAGGLAVYLEDLEPLKYAFRVHDLVMAVRDVSVVVVLPRDLHQQVRYYHTEIYANTKDMLVITPPSQGYGKRLRPSFATCPHPRRSAHEGASLELAQRLPAVRSRRSHLDFLIGVSLGGLKFQLKNRSSHEFGSPATFIRNVPYHEICRQSWRTWHDNVSECLVAWDWRPVGFSTEMVNGLAVFDVDYDDHSGACGHKFPRPESTALRVAALEHGRSRP